MYVGTEFSCGSTFSPQAKQELSEPSMLMPDHTPAGRKKARQQVHPKTLAKLKGKCFFRNKHLTSFTNFR